MIRIWCIIVCIALSGCVKYSGLAAISPKPRQIGWSDVPRTASLTPLLQWEAFPRAIDIKKIADGDAARITQVRYQVRLWIAGEERPHDDRGVCLADWVGVTPIIDVASTSYTAPSPLKPDTRYCWSVRAWYCLDGALRVTQWSRCAPMDGDIPTTFEVPEVNAFDFETPKS